MNNFFKFTLLTISIVSFSFENNSQTVLQGAYVRDGAYEKQDNKLGGKVIEWPYLREADVMYVTRVWQVIDLKQKINQPFYYPVEPIRDRKSLFDVIRDGLLEGASDEKPLMAFDPGPTNVDDAFNVLLSTEQIYEILNPKDSVMQKDKFGEDIGWKVTNGRIGSDQITQYLVKEDWIWDRNRSERYVRIIGIAPLFEGRDENDVSIGTKPLFWLYYPNCRYVFAREEAFNLLNDAQRRSYDDLFEMRYFSSYIVKESNVHNRNINSYTGGGMDALAESERIKEELFILEHDLWHY
jgi:gliding motility associated protien GldN